MTEQGGVCELSRGANTENDETWAGEHGRYTLAWTLAAHRSPVLDGGDTAHPGAQRGHASQLRRRLASPLSVRPAVLRHPADRLRSAAPASVWPLVRLRGSLSGHAGCCLCAGVLRSGCADRLAQVC